MDAGGRGLVALVLLLHCMALSVPSIYCIMRHVPRLPPSLRRMHFSNIGNVANAGIENILQIVMENRHCCMEVTVYI